MSGPDAPDPVDRLRAVMRRLRDPRAGCPWDIEQDFASIAPYTIEEAHEVADAIERAAWDELRDELGDLLLQVVYHAQMAEEAGHFTFAEVAEGIVGKMVRRHPHVFGEGGTPADAAAQTRAWETMKAAERGRAGALDGIAQGLPALMRAQKMQRRAARVGFDWPDAAGVAAKVAEEAAELAAAPDSEGREAELGDMLFTLVNLARHLEIDAEAALRRTNARFARRFAAMEAMLAGQGRRPEEADAEELEALWARAKAGERGR